MVEEKTKEKSKEESKGKKFPQRIKAIVKLEDGRTVPVTFSLRVDGDCVVLPRPMNEVLFSAKAEKGKKRKRRR